MEAYSGTWNRSSTGKRLTSILADRLYLSREIVLMSSESSVVQVDRWAKYLYFPLQNRGW
eukprot:scaffold2201_cov143-Skeletonema_menzelii.AAC.12